LSEKLRKPSIVIDYAIPSINIFLLDQVYTLADAVREYDSLLLCRIDGEPALILTEHVSNDIENEIAKWFRDIQIWHTPILWIKDSEDLKLNVPLHLNLPSRRIQILLRDLGSKDIRAKCLDDLKTYLEKQKETYCSIYHLGVELFNFLYYATIYLTPDVACRIINTLINSTKTNHDIIASGYHVKYSNMVKIYMRHLNLLSKALKVYRRLPQNSCSRDKGDDHVEVINELIQLNREILKSQIRYDLKSFLENLKKHIFNNKVLVLIAPQIIYPLPNTIKIIIGKSGVSIPYMVSYRLEHMFVEALIEVLGLIKSFNPKSFTIYLLAIEWKNMLKQTFNKVISIYWREVLEKLGLQEKEDAIIDKVDDLDEILESKKPDYIIILVLQDYRKGAFINVLDRINEFLRKNRGNGILIVFPETVYALSSPEEERIIHSRTYLGKDILSMPLPRALIYELPLKV